jgi:hypothetical protein
VAIDSVDRLHQTLDAGRIQRDGMLKLLRAGGGGASAGLLYLNVHLGEQPGA